MGGKNHADNSAVVNEQAAEAAQEKQKEADRQARISQGLASIKGAFEGTPTMKTTSSPFNWSGFNGTNAPTGYTSVWTGGGTAGSSMPSGADGSGVRTGTGGSSQYFQATPQAAGSSQSTAAQGGVGGGWALRDASGKVYRPGDALNIDTQTPTGETTGGFDDAFYNKYKQSVLDYYQPQVDKQYSDAKKQAIYGLGRSGNLVSSAANDLTADLKGQYDINTAGVRNQADTAAGDLRSQVNTEEQKAVSQLYATEDPEVAANQSLAAVRDISLQQPTMSPLSALFNVATIGGANVLKGYQNQQNLNTFNSSLPTGSRSSKIVGGGT